MTSRSLTAVDMTGLVAAAAAAGTEHVYPDPRPAT